MWVGLGIMSVGGLVPMACSKVVSGPAGVQPNTFEGHINCMKTKWLWQRARATEVLVQ